MRRALIAIVCLLLIPIAGIQPARAVEEPGPQYSRTTCYVGETIHACGIQNLASSSDYRGFSWNNYFTNWLNGPPPGITNYPAKEWSGTFTTVTAPGQWYVLRHVNSQYNNVPYMAFTVAAARPPVAPVVNSSLTASGRVGAAISTYTITGSNTPTSYNATGLPAGLSINTSNGQITGTPTSAGTTNVTISATNAGGTGTATLAISVAMGTQAALSLASSTGTYGSTLTLASAGGSGGGAVSYSLTSAGTAGCSMPTATTLSSTAAGDCTVTVTKAADANYSIASTAVPIHINRANQDALVLTSTSGTFGTDLTLAASGGSGTGAVSYVVTAAGTANCSLATATTLTSTGAGTCSVRADRALDGNFEAASSPVTTVTLAARGQAAAVLMTSSGDKTFGSAMTLSAAGGSGTGGFAYAVVDVGTAGCSVVGDQLWSTGDVGTTCTVRATRLADTDYQARASDPQTITVARRATQAVLTLSVPTITYRTPVNLVSSGGSGPGAVTLSVTTAGTAGCTIVGDELRVTGDVGTTCGVTVRKAASTNYLQTVSAEQIVTVGSRATQGIVFAAPSDRRLSASAFTIFPTSGSGLGVEVTSVTPTICTAVGLSVTTLLPGTCTLAADQAGDGNYLPATTVRQSFEITPAVQAVNWNPLLGATTTASPLTMNAAVGDALGAVTYSVVDPGTTGCTISDPSRPVLVFTSVGSCVVRAEAEATTTHLAGASTKVFVISLPAASGGTAGAGATGSAGGSSAAGGPGAGGDGASGPVVTTVRSLDPIPEYSGLTPGGERVMVDGEPEPVRVEANATNTGIDVVGSGWRIEIAAVSPSGTPLALAPGGVLAATPGATIRIEGAGYEPLGQMRVYAMDHMNHLGSLMTDHSGALDGSVQLPDTLQRGPDTLQINGFTDDRFVRSVSLGIDVTNPATKPRAVGSRIYFGYRSSQLTSKATRTLAAVVAQLGASHRVRVVVTGAVRSTGATTFDRRLAQRRAATVRQFLVARGMTGTVKTAVQSVRVRDEYRDRRVDVSLTF